MFRSIWGEFDVGKSTVGSRFRAVARAVKMRDSEFNEQHRPSRLLARPACILGTLSMNTFRSLLRMGAFVACLTVAGCAPTTSPGSAAPEAAPPPASAAEWIAMSKPSGSHRLLDGFVGTWDTKITFWSSPEAVPQVSKGSSESSWVLGGRFVKEAFTGEAAGEKFEGIGLMGFDNGRKRLETVWVDSMNTALAIAKGIYDPDTQIYTFEGTVFDPLTATDKSTKSTIKFVSADKYIFTMIDHDRIRGDFKSLEMEYVRRAR